jgi:ketosteroid isomerase-like protein
MSPTRLEDLNAILTRACNSQDFATLLSLYEPDAKMVTRSGEVMVGHEAIEASLRRLVGLGGTFASKTAFCLVHGDIALMNSDWSVTDGRSQDGSPINISCPPAAALRFGAVKRTAVGSCGLTTPPHARGEA